MPSSDAGVFFLAFAALLLLWKPIVFISLIGTYAAAYVFYLIVLKILPRLF